MSTNDRLYRNILTDLENHYIAIWHDESHINRFFYDNDVNNYLRSKDDKVKQVTANFLGEQKSIEIIRSGGETLSDVRPLVRFNVSVMLEKNGRKETGVYGIGGRQSYDAYLEKKKFGFKVNSFEELLNKVSEISVKIKSNNLDIPEIVIGNQSIAKEIYEYIN